MEKTFEEMTFTKEYVFDRIYPGGTFAGSNELLMFDKNKREIFNSNVNVSKWQIKPKIGDHIKYVYEPGSYKHPPILLEIFVNGMVAWLKD